MRTTPREPEHDVPPRAVYTVEDVAAMLGLARCIAYARVRDGSIPARKIGHRWVISKAAFHAWLDDDDRSARQR